MSDSGTLTSAAMLGAKLAQVMEIKMKADEARRLETEREALVAELEESLSPELAKQVEAVILRRSSSIITVETPLRAKMAQPNLKGRVAPMVNFDNLQLASTQPNPCSRTD
jgi:hypothetical protein